MDERDPPGHREWRGGGLFALDRSSGKWEKIPTGNQPVFQYINCLLADGDLLWVGTRGGLVRLKVPQTAMGVRE